jgi:predicted SAM-dependent methyltransferase
MDTQRMLRTGRALRRIPVARQLLDLRVAAIARRRELAEKRSERGFAARDRKTIEALKGRGDLKINVGSSSVHIDGWLNADLRRDANSDTLKMDATAPCPFRSGSALAVNSEHFIEHIERELAPAYFAEVFRVLRPGGVVRTSTPSLRGICEAYMNGDVAALEAHRAAGYTAATHADVLNNYVHMGGEHRYVYDEETLALVLEEAGFTQIEAASFGTSQHEVLQGIDPHPMGSLAGLVICLDAVKL